MVRFKPGEQWPDLRPDALQVPEPLARWLDKTYEENLFVEIPVESESKETSDIIRASRIYCRRQGKTLKYEMGGDEKQQILRLKMRDVRSYVRQKPVNRSRKTTT